MDTSDEWIRQRAGIEKRYWVPQNEEIGSSDLGMEAASIALKSAGWQAEEVDLIIFATQTPDIFLPGSGCLMQDKLGLTETPVLDIRQQCTAFMYGITTADAYIRSGLAQKILFVGAEVHSSALDLTDRGRDTAVLFGDGAGAVCLEGIAADPSVGVLSSVLHAQGELADVLMVEAPGCKFQPFVSHGLLEDGRHLPQMDGRTVFKTAVRRLPLVADEALEKAGLEKDDIDLFIPHQANYRINEGFRNAMDLPEEKVFQNIQWYGNTTAASIPIALDEALARERIGSGSTVMFLGLGAGLTWGAVIYRFP
jgi:3-oxoacyl-[acyl-carrier-protein] synthase-3